VARKAAVKTESKQLERVVSFRAPDTIHGALKQITGKLEMSQCRIGGRVPFERDILNWLVADLYQAGPTKWPERIESAHAQFVKFCDQN
jgi:hypothetical protein